MPKFTQHVPGFVDSEPAEFEYEKQQQFLDNIVCRRWREMPGFKQFSKSYVGYHNPARWLLMAEFVDSHWVVAYLTEEPDLPTWVAPVSGNSKEVDSTGRIA